MKKGLSLLLVMLLIASQLVFAEDKLPSAIWSLFNQEAALKASDDLDAKIDNWLTIIELFDTWDDQNEKKLGIVTPRYQRMALAYEEQLNYDMAIATWHTYIKYASILENKGLWDQFARLGAESKVVNLASDLDLYVERPLTDQDPYYGAPYEPKAGLYFGATYDNDPRVGNYDLKSVQAVFPKKNSIYPFYLEFGDEITDFDRFYKQAQAGNVGISLAWNAYEVYPDMGVHKAYIQRTARYLNDLSVPVFVRYGSEFNIAEGFEDAKAYVSNYRYVADVLKELAPNVALVWSPNEITDASRDLLDYYPGDAYVDWVGLSTYTYYYFGDKVDWGDQQASIDNQFFTGDKANPLSKVKAVIELFKDKKPIMISENGVSHYSKVANEDMTDWAATQLTRAYAYIPLKYPQVKAMFYFNVDSIATTKQTYALHKNKTIHDLYQALVGDENFLSDHAGSAKTIYGLVNQDLTPLKGPFVSLKTLAIVPGNLNPTVVYHLNGKVLATEKTLPYTYELDTSHLQNGNHNLEITVLTHDNQPFKSAKYVLVKKDLDLSLQQEVSLAANLEIPLGKVNSLMGLHLLQGLPLGLLLEIIDLTVLYLY